VNALDIPAARRYTRAHVRFAFHNNTRLAEKPCRVVRNA
jgi:hypothetical protein